MANTPLTDEIDRLRAVLGHNEVQAIEPRGKDDPRYWVQHYDGKIWVDDFGCVGLATAQEYAKHQACFSPTRIVEKFTHVVQTLGTEDLTARN